MKILDLALELKKTIILYQKKTLFSQKLK